MPYGIPKKYGGDSEKNKKWMEKCVSSIMSKQNKTKQSAIQICKYQFIKMREEASLGKTFTYNPDDIKEN